MTIAPELLAVFLLQTVGTAVFAVFEVETEPCRRHGIHPLRATPRRRYYELRGWTWSE